MFVHFLKFLHLIITLGLLGSAMYCLILVGSKKIVTASFNQQHSIARANKLMLVLVFLAAITGTFLVYPKHFTFHTPWIQAAYVLVILFSLILVALLFFKTKYTSRWIGQSVYLLLIVLLICIVHDAVTKTTFLLS